MVLQLLARRLAFPLRFALVLTLSLASLSTVAAQQIPTAAERVTDSEVRAAEVWRNGHSLYLRLDSEANEGVVELPRFAAPLRQITWLTSDTAAAPSNASQQLSLSPELTTWTVRWADRPDQAKLIRLDFDVVPLLMHELSAITHSADGSFFLPAHLATTQGEKVRYEPQSFKNTVGYWVGKQDQATWTIELDQPGKFNIAILQGCGTGQGGSVAKIEIRPVPDNSPPTSTQIAAMVEFEVLETGHFQNFQWRQLSSVELPAAGQYQVRISPKEIKKAALMDVRALHLIRLP